MLSQLRRDTMQSRMIENVNRYRKRKFCEETYQLQRADNILEVLSYSLGKINDLAILVNEYLTFKDFPHLPVPELKQPIIMPLVSSKKIGVDLGYALGSGYPLEITSSLQTLMNNLHAHVLLTLFDPDCKIEERIKTEVKNVFLSVPLHKWQRTSRIEEAGYFFKWNDHLWHITHTSRKRRDCIWVLHKQNDFILKFTFPPFKLTE
jgi:hypothetical protein